MKKFVLFAMLLGSSFLFGCTEPKKEPAKEGDKPAAGADDKKPADEAKPAGEEKPADKTETPPAEPAK